MRLLKLLHSNLNLRACLLRPLALVVALLTASAGAWAQHDQHGGHEGHTMPKKAAPKPKATPKRKPAPRKQTRQPFSLR
ncbi:MAG: hypothetical protein LC803_08585 [Acidobacteria bacterium]|nr:hypothetical protein [Acidobacteriota bacterium]